MDLAERWMTYTGRNQIPETLVDIIEVCTFSERAVKMDDVVTMWEDFTIRRLAAKWKRNDFQNEIIWSALEKSRHNMAIKEIDAAEAWKRLAKSQESPLSLTRSRPSALQLPTSNSLAMQE
jgi:hypothetical protein